MKNLLIKIVFTVVFISFQFTYQANATDWYVDNAATAGANNGASWTDAWQSFADIQWNSIQPGDTIYISGGTVSKTYSDRLEINGVNGTPSSPVTIKVGQTSGHNGEVIITNDGPYAGIFFTKSTYVTINGNVGNNQNMKIQNCTVSGVTVYSGCHHILLTYLNVNNNGDGGPGPEHGIVLSNLNNFDEIYPTVEISYCKIHSNWQDQINGPSDNVATKFGNILIHDNEIYNIHDDGVAIAYGGLDYYNNVMHTLVSGGGEGHPDGLQLYGEYLRIYNNVFRDFNQPGLIANAYIQVATVHPPGSEEIQRAFRDIYVYNNLVYDDQIYDYNALRGLEILPGTNYTHKVVIANNTIIGTPAYGLGFRFNEIPGRTNDCIIANNIVHNCNTNGGRTTILIMNGSEEEFCPLDTNIGDGDDGDDIPQPDFCDGLFFDNNLISAGEDGCDGITIDGEFYHYEELTQEYNVNVNGVNADPSLDASYRPDSSTDHGVDKGINLSDFFSYDLDGTPRSSNWDIGAYEYTTETNINNKFTGGIQFFRIYPNPFKTNTSIAYTLPKNSDVEISLYDVTGRKVQTLHEGHQIAGEHNLDVELNTIEAGVFFFQLEAGTYKATSKCIVIH